MRNRTRLAARFASAALGVVRLLGQEEAGVRFEPVDRGPDWGAYAVLAAAAGLVVAFYLFGRRWLRLHRARIPWRQLRRWWPWGVLIWGVALFCLLEFVNLPEPLMVCLPLPFLLCNLPGMALSFFVILPLGVPPGWDSWCVLIPSLWLGAYGSVVGLEAVARGGDVATLFGEGGGPT